MHPVYRADFTKYNWAEVSDYYANAFFCGQCGSGHEDIIMFGEGLPAGYYIVSIGAILWTTSWPRSTSWRTSTRTG